MAGSALAFCLQLLFILCLTVTIFVQGLEDTDGDDEPLVRLERSAESQGESSACRSIEIEMCAEFNYTNYVFPNVLGHPDERTAMQEIRSFYPLSSAPCGQAFRQFMCILYFPPCTVLQKSIPPCQSLCLKAKDDCSAYVKHRGYIWPRGWTCENFPESGLCVTPITSNTSTSTSSSSSSRRRSGSGSSSRSSSSSRTIGSGSSSRSSSSSSVSSSSGGSRSISRSSSSSSSRSRSGQRSGEKRDTSRTPTRNYKQNSRDSSRDKVEFIDQKGERPQIQRRCQTFSSGFCTYKLTSLPNVVGHTTAEEAAADVNMFYPLVQTGCSAQLQDFLCNAYFPQCSETRPQETVLPCKQLCLQVYLGCRSSMREFGFYWPEYLSCDRFPETGACWNGTGTENVESKNERTEQKLTSEQEGQVRPDSEGRCRPFKVPLCRHLSYNLTSVPNMLGHRNPEDAGLEVHQFYPLVRVQCSPQLQDFLCGVYFPQCSANSQRETVIPCKSLCLQARSGCETVLQKFGYSWPEHLNCNRFPSTGMCWNGTEKENLESKNERTEQNMTTEIDKPPHTEGKARPESEGRCRPVEGPFCSHLSYNSIGFPNMLGHRNPEEAAQEVHQFYPLVKFGCSPHLQDFLCGVYFPLCNANSQPKVLIPCRSLCVQVRLGCKEFMEEYGFSWSESLNCNRFPSTGMCWNGTEKGPTSEVSQEKSTAVQPMPTKEPTKAIDDRIDQILLIQMLNSTFKTPVLNWLRSSSKANWAQVKLAGEQTKVARLTREKLALEISLLKRKEKSRG